ncbi:hypothetical protein D1007_07129 [Hordeum vulgare]|nr:hypothetical protein D1007_07129 [Hordeum vulgare]KAI5011235.1 hypothetical protein ZWY2020_013372 [Hordeum vulgare]
MPSPAPATQNPQTFQSIHLPPSLRSPVFFLLSCDRGDRRRSMATTMGVCRAVKMICGTKVERVVGTGKAPGSCPSCGGPVVATDVESERRILCLPLCVKNKRKYSCTRCFRRLVTVYS